MMLDVFDEVIAIETIGDTSSPPTSAVMLTP